MRERNIPNIGMAYKIAENKGYRSSRKEKIIEKQKNEKNIVGYELNSNKVDGEGCFLFARIYQGHSNYNIMIDSLELVKNGKT